MKLCQITNCSDDREICGLSADSREIKKGFLFGSLNGDQYIKSALDNGASAFIVPEDCSFDFPKIDMSKITAILPVKFAIIIKAA